MRTKAETLRRSRWRDVRRVVAPIAKEPAPGERCREQKGDEKGHFRGRMASCELDNQDERAERDHEPLGTVSLTAPEAAVVVAIALVPAFLAEAAKAYARKRSNA
jgi:hypothetical protein